MNPIALPPVQFAGHYTLRRIGPDGRTRQILEFDNVITDLGLDLITTAPAYAYGFGYYLNVCCVGTGNTPPSYTDTALASYLASAGRGDASMAMTYVAGPPTYWKGVATYRFGTGVAAGNLTEIGTYPTNGSALGLFSRALILDSGGVPTTLTVLPDEILDVTYELREYISTADVLGTFVSGGVTYNTVCRPSEINTPGQLGSVLRRSTNGEPFNIDAYSGALGSITAAPSGSSYWIIYNNDATKDPYTPGQRHLDVSTTAPVGQANYGAGGIKAFRLGSYLHKYQMSFLDSSGNGIPKVVGQKMSVKFRFSWDRYTP